ncbi:MAG TPA: regulatory iron-sulfur-containing complex subunit RicT [bacterium]
MQRNIIELKFKGERRELYENHMEFPFKVGDYAIVEADKGVDFGRVNQISSLLNSKAGNSKLRKIIRKSSPEEMQKAIEIRHHEKDALNVCKEKVKNHNLSMKLVDCEFQFDRHKITFYFTAEQRVDFRKLVKDVASVYKTRIEFRQIGARDEARRLGGYGVCGRTLCCSSWIKEFKPITTQAAKDQNLALNPSKLAGVCGRLKCCLMYERDFYNEAIRKFPQLAKPITTERGEGIVSNIDIFNEKVIVLYQDDTTESYPLEYIKTRVYKCENDCGKEHGNLESLTDDASHDLNDKPDLNNQALSGEDLN